MVYKRSNHKGIDAELGITGILGTFCLSNCTGVVGTAPFIVILCAVEAPKGNCCVEADKFFDERRCLLEDTWVFWSRKLRSDPLALGIRVEEAVAG